MTVKSIIASWLTATLSVARKNNICKQTGVFWTKILFSVWQYRETACKYKTFLGYTLACLWWLLWGQGLHRNILLQIDSLLYMKGFRMRPCTSLRKKPNENSTINSIEVKHMLLPCAFLWHFKESFSCSSLPKILFPHLSLSGLLSGLLIS